MGKGSAREPPVPPEADKDAAMPGKGPGENTFPVHEHVGRQLKALFDEITKEPIPDKFRVLLDELEQKQAKPPIKSE